MEHINFQDSYAWKSFKCKKKWSYLKLENIEKHLLYESNDFEEIVTGKAIYEYLISHRALGSNHGMKHHVLQVSESTNSVKQKLGTISTLHIHHRVPFLLATLDCDVGPITTHLMLTTAAITTTTPLVIQIRMHQLVEPPLRVGLGRVDCFWAHQPDTPSLSLPIMGLNHVL